MHKQNYETNANKNYETYANQCNNKRKINDTNATTNETNAKQKTMKPMQKNKQ